MNDTSYESPLELMNKEAWAGLTPKEQALCVSYKKQLEKNVKVSHLLMREINAIHEKHEDFHMGCVPGKKESDE